MKISTTGLIIKQQNIGEKDTLVTVLTRDMGVIRAFVRGAKNIKNPKSAPTSLLCYSELGIYSGKDAYVIDDASVIEMFFDLRKDVSRIALAQYFCELAAHICPTEQECSEQLSLVLNALHLLSKGTQPPLIIKACVELRLVAMAGYLPDLVMCKDCGTFENEEMYFLLDGGSIKCSECFKKAPSPSSVAIDIGILRAMRHIVYSENKKVFSFTLSEKSLEKLSYITESYICKVLERDFSTLHFFKTINS